MAIGDIWRIAFVGTNVSQEYVNIWHVKFKSVGATVPGAVTKIKTDFYDLFKTKCATNFILTNYHAVQLASPAPVVDGTCSVTGTDASNAMPPQVALVASLRTGIAGRSYRGRLYLAGLCEANNEGIPVAAAVSAIQTYFDDLVASIGSGGASSDYEWGVWSKKLGFTAPSTYNLAAGWHPVTSVVVRSIWNTQRRRATGVGA